MQRVLHPCISHPGQHLRPRGEAGRQGDQKQRGSRIFGTKLGNAELGESAGFDGGHGRLVQPRSAEASPQSQSLLSRRLQENHGERAHEDSVFHAQTTQRAHSKRGGSGIMFRQRS